MNTNIMILKSSDKNFKAVVIKMIPQEIRNMLKNKWGNSLSKEIDNIKKNQMKIKKLENEMNEINEI